MIENETATKSEYPKLEINSDGCKDIWTTACYKIGTCELYNGSKEFISSFIIYKKITFMV